MKKKERLVGIIMAVIMSTIMGLLFSFIARKTASEQALASMPPAPIMYVTSVIESIIVGVIVVLVFPLMKAGGALCKKFNATPPSLKFSLLNGLPIAVVNAVVVSAVCSFISIAQSHSHMPKEVAPPLMAMWFGSWIKTLPISIIVSYLLAVIIAPFIVKAVGLGAPPSNAGGQNQITTN